MEGQKQSFFFNVPLFAPAIPQKFPVPSPKLQFTLSLEFPLPPLNPFPFYYFCTLIVDQTLLLPTAASHAHRLACVNEIAPFNHFIKSK
jgi:hypothetical protein